MKKFASLLIATIFIFGLLSIGASADGNVVKRGTATVDGILDEAYKHSLVIEGVGTGKHHPEVSGYSTWNYTASANIYALYDDEMLYLFAEVRDDDVLTQGYEYCTSHNPYQNDCIEFRFPTDDNVSNPFKIGLDAYGYQLFGNTEDYNKIDYDSIRTATYLHEDGLGYNIEIAVPCNISPLDIFDSNKVGLAIGFNDLDAEHITGAYSADFLAEFQYADHNGAYNCPIFYDISDEYAMGGSTTEDTTADTTVEDTTAEDTTAEDTTAEDTTADDTTAEDTTADDTTADDTTAEDTEAEDTTAEDTEADDTTAEDTEADDTTAEDTEADDTTAEDTEAEDTTAEDTEADDTTAEDTEADDTTAEDTEADDTTADTTGEDKTEEKGGNNALLIGGIIAAVVVVVIVIAVIASKKKKN